MAVSSVTSMKQDVCVCVRADRFPFGSFACLAENENLPGEGIWLAVEGPGHFSVANIVCM